MTIFIDVLCTSMRLSRRPLELAKESFTSKNSWKLAQSLEMLIQNKFEGPRIIKNHSKHPRIIQGSEEFIHVYFRSFRNNRKSSQQRLLLRILWQSNSIHLFFRNRSTKNHQGCSISMFKYWRAHQTQQMKGKKTRCWHWKRGPACDIPSYGPRVFPLAYRIQACASIDAEHSCPRDIICLRRSSLTWPQEKGYLEVHNLKHLKPA